MNHQDAKLLLYYLEPCVRRIMKEELAKCFVPPAAPSPLLTYSEAAERLGTSLSTFNRMVKRRIIAVVVMSNRTLRVKEEEIQRVIEKRTRKAIV